MPASFNFPHTGKLLSLSFVLFAGWFADAQLSPSRTTRAWRRRACSTLFGNVNAAIPFLLDMFRIPADTFQLFVATGVVNARFGTLLSAVHTLAMAAARHVRGDRRAQDRSPEAACGSRVITACSPSSSSAARGCCSASP